MSWCGIVTLLNGREQRQNLPRIARVAAGCGRVHANSSPAQHPGGRVWRQDPGRQRIFLGRFLMHGAVQKGLALVSMDNPFTRTTTPPKGRIGEATGNLQDFTDFCATLNP